MMYSGVWLGASRRYSEPSSNQLIALEHARRAVEVEHDHVTPREGRVHHVRVGIQREACVQGVKAWGDDE